MPRQSNLPEAAGCRSEIAGLRLGLFPVVQQSDVPDGSTDIAHRPLNHGDATR